MAASIPRFLLPQRSSIWRSRIIPSSTIAKSIRNVSQKASPLPKPNLGQSRPPLLEKPAKFRPPSHGQKLRQELPRYPGPRLSDAELKSQQTKSYPNMMPPKGTFLHWFLNDRSIHLYITLGTLVSLAGYTGIVHFQRTSKFAHMLPPASDLFFHPITFVRTSIEVLKLHTEHVTAETQERRTRKLDDVMKRVKYRKTHGLDKEGFSGWIAGLDGKDEGENLPNDAVVLAEDGGQTEEQVQRPRKQVKKWLGIW